MSDAEQETKPNLTDEKSDVKSETHLNIKVSDGTSEIFFKIKRSTPLRRLMEAFAKRQGKSLDSLRFLSEGQRVNGDQTPDDLDLEDGDVIEAHQEQVSIYSVPLTDKFFTNRFTDRWRFLEGVFATNDYVYGV
jgi:small ubiquitin-related modifier